MRSKHVGTPLTLILAASARASSRLARRFGVLLTFTASPVTTIIPSSILSWVILENPGHCWTTPSSLDQVTICLPRGMLLLHGPRRAWQPGGRSHSLLFLANLNACLSSYSALQHKTPAPVKSRWLREEDEKLVALRSRGLTWPQVAREMPSRSYFALPQRLRQIARSTSHDELCAHAARVTRKVVPFTEAEDHTIKELRRQGMLFREIAKHIPGRTKYDVAWRCRQISHHKPPSYIGSWHRWSLPETERLINMGNAGSTIGKIASELDRSVESIRKKLLSLGAPVQRTTMWWSVADVAMLQERSAQGTNMVEIAEALGRSYESVKTKWWRLKAAKAAGMQTHASALRAKQQDESLSHANISDNSSDQTITTRSDPFSPTQMRRIHTSTAPFSSRIRASSMSTAVLNYSSGTDALPIRRKKHNSAPWSREEDERLVSLKAQGLRWYDITPAFPTRSWSAITARFGRLARGGQNDPVRAQAAMLIQPTSAFTEAEDRKVDEMRREGLLFREIAERLPDRRPEIIAARVRKRSVQGISTTRRGAFSEEEHALLLRLRAEGYNWATISRQFPDRSMNSLIMHVRLTHAAAGQPCAVAPPKRKQKTKLGAGDPAHNDTPIARRKACRWSTEMTEKLLKLHRAGKRATFIANELGVSHQQVRTKLQNHISTYPWSPADNQRLMRMTDSNILPEHIAMELGRSITSVRTRITWLNSRRKSPRRWDREHENTLREMKLQGAKNCMIARALGRSTGAVSNKWFDMQASEPTESTVEVPKSRLDATGPEVGEEDTPGAGELKVLEALDGLATSGKITALGESPLLSRTKASVAPASARQYSSTARKGGIRRRKHKDWSRAEDDELVRLRAEGQGWREIVIAFPDRTWATLAWRFGKLARGSPDDPICAQAASLLREHRPFSDSEDVQMTELRGKGLQFQQIAETLPGRTAETIHKRYRTLHKPQVLRQERREWSAEEAALLAKLKLEGHETKVIARHITGRSEQAIDTRWKTHGGHSVRNSGLAAGASSISNSKRCPAPWTKDQTAQLTAMRRAGKKPRAIATELKFDPVQVRRRLTELRQYPGRRYRWGSADMAKLSAMRQDGYTSAEIATKLDRSVCAINIRIRKLRESGDIPMAVPAWTGADDLKLREMRDQGTLLRDIAQRLGKSVWSVNYRWRRMQAADHKHNRTSTSGQIVSTHSGNVSEDKATEKRAEANIGHEHTSTSRSDLEASAKPLEVRSALQPTFSRASATMTSVSACRPYSTFPSCRKGWSITNKSHHCLGRTWTASRGSIERLRVSDRLNCHRGLGSMTISQQWPARSHVSIQRRLLTKTSPQSTTVARGRKTWTSEDEKTLSTMRNEGSTNVAIARRLNRTRDAVQSHLYNHFRGRPSSARPKPAKPRQYSASEAGTILSMRRRGCTWEQIAAALPGRQPHGVALYYQHRILTQLHLGVSDKEAVSGVKSILKWSTSETEKLLKLREVDGMTWHEIMRHMPDRSYDGIRKRYINLCTQRGTKPAIAKNMWTEKEDNILSEGRKAGKTYEEIAVHFPHRTRSGLEKRMYRLRDRTFIAQHLKAPQR